MYDETKAAGKLLQAALSSVMRFSSRPVKQVVKSFGELTHNALGRIRLKQNLDGLQNQLDIHKSEYCSI